MRSGLEIATTMVFLSLCVGGGAEAQSLGSSNKDELFSGTEKFAVNATSVEQIDLDPSSLSLVDGVNAAKGRGVLMSVVHKYTYERPGMYSVEDVSRFRRKLESPDWHCSIRRWDTKAGTSMDVCSKTVAGGLSEYALISVKPTQLTFIHSLQKLKP